MYLLNAFSLNMLPQGFSCGSLTIDAMSVGDVRRVLSGGFTSAVGHADTAAVFGSVLGTTVPCNRANVTLSIGDSAVVGQYTGPRLPEGATSLPDGATIKWFRVTLFPDPSE